MSLNYLNKRLITLILASFIGFGLSLGGHFQLSEGFIFGKIEPVSAQALRPEQAATKIYELLPDLPKENQYVNQETQQVNSQHTLVSRLISYHIYLKNRPVSYRIDWKLTLADYLGINEKIKPDNYPGYQTLTQNPYENDLIAIQNLTRQQRNALVTALVQVYSPQTQNNNNNNPESSPNSNQNEQSKPNIPQLPQPGAADLLKF